jgi:hypothetical protein
MARVSRRRNFGLFRQGLGFATFLERRRTGSFGLANGPMRSQLFGRDPIQKAADAGAQLVLVEGLGDQRQIDIVRLVMG